MGGHLTQALVHHVFILTLFIMLTKFACSSSTIVSKLKCRTIIGTYPYLDVNDISIFS